MKNLENFTTAGRTESQPGNAKPQLGEYETRAELGLGAPRSEKSQPTLSSSAKIQSDSSVKLRSRTPKSPTPTLKKIRQTLSEQSFQAQLESVPLPPDEKEENQP